MSFDSPEGVRDFLAAEERAAMANLTAEQRVMADMYGWDISEPVYWRRFYPARRQPAVRRRRWACTDCSRPSRSTTYTSYNALSILYKGT